MLLLDGEMVFRIKVPFFLNFFWVKVWRDFTLCFFSFFFLSLFEKDQ